VFLICSITFKAIYIFLNAADTDRRKVYKKVAAECPIHGKTHRVGLQVATDAGFVTALGKAGGVPREGI
jgi:hypothetical protein